MPSIQFNILNQLQTPAFYASSLATRPTFGYPGRLFVDTDNPSTGMYRDTGTSWILIAQPAPIITGYVPYLGATSNLDMGTFSITATSLIGGGSGITSLPTNTALYPTLNQNTSGTAANITASSNSTITTLSALSLPYSQVSGTPSLVGFVPYTGATTNLSLGSFGITANSLTLPTFTIGSVLFAGTSGLIGQDNTNLFWDNTNDRLGIQTNTPGVALDVHNNVAGTTTVQLNNTATSNTYIAFLKNSVGYWRIGSTATANTFDLINITNSNTALSFSNTNNVGTFNSSVIISPVITGVTGLTINGTITSLANIARGQYIQSTLTATANSDQLYGLEINPTFSVGAFTNVGTYGLKVSGITYFNGSTVYNSSAFLSNTDMFWIVNGNRNVQIGNFGGVTFSGTRNVALGSNNITAAINNSITIGNSSTNAGGMVIGYQSAVSNNGIAIGYSASSGFTGSIAIGGQFGISATAINQFLVESVDWYIGNPLLGSSSNATSLNAQSSNGLNLNGAIFRINGSKGSGAGTPGDIALQTATTGASGSVQQTLTERLRIFNSTGNILMQSGGIFTDNVADKLQVTGSAIFSTKISTTAGTNTLNTTSGNTIIGSATDNGKKLQVNGTTTTSGFSASGETLTVSATLSEQYYHVFQGAVGQTFTLLTPLANNLQYLFINNTANAVTIAAATATNIIDLTNTSQTSITVLANARTFIIADGNTKYYQIY
jgi:hypothetical protein